MDFHNLYAHGFARVAAVTLPIAMVQPAANAEAVLEQARELAADGVALAIFPELCLTGYSIEDLLLQDPVLDAADEAVGLVADGSADLDTVLVIGAPLRSLHRIYNCAIVIHRALRGLRGRSRSAPGDCRARDFTLILRTCSEFALCLCWQALERSRSRRAVKHR